MKFKFTHRSNSAFTAIVLLFLNGCSSFTSPSILSLGASSDDAETLIEDDRKQITNTNSSSSTANKDEITQLRQEITQLKLSLVPVLELHSELEVIINTIEMGSQPEVGFLPFKSPVEQTNPLSVLNRKEGFQSSSEIERKTQGFGSMEDKLSNVNLQATEPLSNSTPLKRYRGPNKTNQITTGVYSQDKFSNVNVQAAQAVLDMSLSQDNSRNVKKNPVTGGAYSNDKFSNVESSVQSSPSNNMRCPLVEAGQGYALHIASFVTRSSAEDFISKVLPDVNALSDCKMVGLIDIVTVKNKRYFSARLGSFRDQLAAKGACDITRPFTAYCAVVSNEGVNL
jgi:hypothetical protein